MEQSSSDVFLTPKGREIFLSQLHLTRTYAGHMEGSPETISPYIRREIKKEIGRYLLYPEALVIIDNREKALPSFQWIAKFESRDAVHRDDLDYSSHLRVCWFSAEIPNILREALQAIVDKIDYEANAEDYDIMP